MILWIFLHENMANIKLDKQSMDCFEDIKLNRKLDFVPIEQWVNHKVPSRYGFFAVAKVLGTNDYQVQTEALSLQKVTWGFSACEIHTQNPWCIASLQGKCFF